MKMAKADEKDLKAARDLCAVLDDMDGGYYPRTLNGEPADDAPTYFDDEDPEHLRALYDRIKQCIDAAPGGLFRVMAGMTVLLDPNNAIVDPDADSLELHPRFAATFAEAKALREAIREAVETAGTLQDGAITARVLTPGQFARLESAIAAQQGEKP